MVVWTNIMPVVYKSTDSGLRFKLAKMLLDIPSDVFYSNGSLLPDGCKALNKRLVSELQREFGSSLKGAFTNRLRDFYSYPVEELITLFCMDEKTWYGCMFIPDSDFGQLPKDDISPCDFVMRDMNRLLKPILELADFTNFQMIGYFYPMSLARYGIDVSYALNF